MSRKPVIPDKVRDGILKRILAELDSSAVDSVHMEWVARYSAFILLVAHDNVSWKHGATATTLTAHEAVKLELFISKMTAPIIAKLQATAQVRPAAKPLKKRSLKKGGAS